MQKKRETKEFRVVFKDDDPLLLLLHDLKHQAELRSGKVSMSWLLKRLVVKGLTDYFNEKHKCDSEMAPEKEVDSGSSSENSGEKGENWVA